MLKSIVDALNGVQSRVWSVLQFVALLLLVGAGVLLMIKGHVAEGTGLMSGGFALIKNEVSGAQS